MSEYPCKVGDTVYVIDDVCNEGCPHETELCQRRICKYFKQFIVPVKVTKIETKNYGGEDVIVFHDETGKRKYQLGETTFLTEADAREHMFREVSFEEEKERERRDA